MATPQACTIREVTGRNSDGSTAYSLDTVSEPTFSEAVSEAAFFSRKLAAPHDLFQGDVRIARVYPDGGVSFA